MNVATQLITKFMLGILCRVGLHEFSKKPILASLDTYWMQGGEECCRCKNRKISFSEATMHTQDAFQRGKKKSENSFLAYGSGVKDVVRLYGKAYVQKIIDDMPDREK